MLLSAEIRLFHGVMRKAFQAPHTGEGGVASFICVEIEASPWVSDAPSPSVSPREESSRVCSKARARVSVQIFCFVFKLSPWETTDGCSVVSVPVRVA